MKSGIFSAFRKFWTFCVTGTNFELEKKIDNLKFCENTNKSWIFSISFEKKRRKRKGKRKNTRKNQEHFSKLWTKLCKCEHYFRNMNNFWQKEHFWKFWTIFELFEKLKKKKEKNLKRKEIYDCALGSNFVSSCVQKIHARLYATACAWCAPRTPWCRQPCFLYCTLEFYIRPNKRFILFITIKKKTYSVHFIHPFIP